MFNKGRSPFRELVLGKSPLFESPLVKVPLGESPENFPQ